ncbi:hypothetical protein SEVIR_8G208400v4 [Setaria viridis]|uniref:AAA+ ATPase domain-containing protein n=1 Tax=Setaria viridis TaxID=4556 RepID=A0A4U6TLL9_SETVI|nr:disease resistance protein RGA5-like [Setaria viridis]XP_034569664.1 disease resistance protein RGA5-like [Setaria viridis]TKW01883.1 hypothetical protein SEVIR_8G208400v2 [Setaria viridis]
MEIVAGALPSLLPKLAELLVGEYNLQKEVKGGIIFLQAELESMQGALEKISRTPVDKIDDQDKIWARKVREMSYDIEDNIDKYIVQCKGRKMAEEHSFKEAIDRTLKWFRQPKIRHNIATEIREIKSRVIEVHERRRRYEVSLGVDKPVTVDPRLFAQYTEVKELVGIDEARDELISKIVIEENEVPKKQGKIVSIVGFGGLGKTTLANAVYEKIRARFDCCAFVSVSQTPNLKKLYNDLLYDLGKNINNETLDEMRLINILRQFLQEKRYFVVVDDVWDISVWKMIRCALPDNDVGYTIITTTRISDVAEQVGGAYPLKPLSLNNSQKLLYRRIFGNGNKDNNEEEENYPHEELAEVSNRILKKCAGVPLAIITIASLLACKPRNKMEWYEVYNSVGTGLENNLDVENMRKILSFSYYELPCHLRACLLYLSMFPEDYRIEKDRLIRMWIGEGFIQCEKAEKSLFELGESYFNELINRSMIQPIHNSFDDMISSCHVHDMVLDLIRSLSSEENFVTVLSNMGGTSPSNMIRRLSLQNGQESHVMAQATFGMKHARSVVVFPAAASLVPPLDCYRVLRVLDLEDCSLSKANSSLKYLGNLHHLRYLGLGKTCISQLPEEIGNLQLLQTLDVRGNLIFRFPSSVVQLRKLMCLYMDQSIRIPNGIGNLTCLEQLSWLHIDDSNRNIIEELGQLTELRQLSIVLADEWNDKLLECLCKLQKMQDLVITIRPGERSIGGLDALVGPRHLRRLITQGSCLFSTLPAWVNPSLLLDLTWLCIDVRELHQADLEILGRLPALRLLNLKLDNKNLGILAGFVVGAGAFPCLVSCEFWQFVWPVVFQQGAMPRLGELRFIQFYVGEARGIACNDGSLNLGLENLPSLQEVHADLHYDGAGKEEAEQAEAALTHEAEMHPNHPRHHISMRL